MMQDNRMINGWGLIWIALHSGQGGFSFVVARTELTANGLKAIGI
jgi:hypothetical protein